MVAAAHEKLVPRRHSNAPPYDLAPQATVLTPHPPSPRRRRPETGRPSPRLHHSSRPPTRNPQIFFAAATSFGSFTPRSPVVAPESDSVRYRNRLALRHQRALGHDLGSIGLADTSVGNIAGQSLAQSFAGQSFAGQSLAGQSLAGQDAGHRVPGRLRVRNVFEASSVSPPEQARTHSRGTWRQPFSSRRENPAARMVNLELSVGQKEEKPGLPYVHQRTVGRRHSGVGLHAAAAQTWHNSDDLHDAWHGVPQRQSSVDSAAWQDDELKVVFEPRKQICIDADWQSGLVQFVDRAHQAHRLGVRVGMRFLTVAGKPFTKDRYETAALGCEPFETTFAQARSRAVEQKAAEEKEAEQEKAPPTVETMAHALVDKCGSLERAFANFDYNRRGKVTRSLWECGLGLLHLDCEELTGYSAKILFRMMDVWQGPSTYDVTLDGWLNFFMQVKGASKPRRLRSWPGSEKDGLVPLTVKPPADIPVATGTGPLQRRLKVEELEVASETASSSTSIALEDDLRHDGVPNASASASTTLGSASASTDAETCDSEVSSPCSQASNDLQTSISLQPASAESSLQPASAESHESVAAPSETLEQALRGANPTREVLNKLSEEELDSFAEQQQLVEELEALDIHGMEALAYLLVAKCGSLKAAFKWFDSTKRGQLSRVAWETGVKMLHIDVEKLTGFTTKKIFSMMDMIDKDGTVSRKEWKEFFKAVEDGELLLRAAGQNGGGSFKERATAKKDALRKARGAWTSRPGSKNGSKTGRPAGETSNPEEDENKLPRLLGEKPKEKQEMHRQSEAAAVWQNSSRFHTLVVAHLSAEEHAGARGSSGQRIGSKSSTGSRIGSKSGSGGDAQTVGMVVGQHIAQENAGNPEDALDFFATDLCSIRDDNEFRKEIRRMLAQLLPGEGRIFPTNLTAAQHRMVRQIAREMGMFCDKAKEGDAFHLEVWNLVGFAEGVREKLQQLTPGAHEELSSLSAQQRMIAQGIAEEMGLSSEESEESGTVRSMTIENNIDFREKVRLSLTALKPGETKAFEDDLSNLQTKTVRNITNELGLRFVDVSLAQLDTTGGGLRKGMPVGIYVENPADESEADCSDAEDAITQEEDSSDLFKGNAESEASIIQRLFFAYASGSQNGERIFLRFPDLRKLARELKDEAPEALKMFESFSESLESVFNETLQLQMDMGTRTSKGLTLKWFMVFVQQAIHRIGYFIISLLMMLLKRCTA